MAGRTRVAVNTSAIHEAGGIMLQPAKDAGQFILTDGDTTLKEGTADEVRSFGATISALIAKLPRPARKPRARKPKAAPSQAEAA